MATWLECIQHIPSFHETTYYPIVLSQLFFFCLPVKLVTARDKALFLSLPMAVLLALQGKLSPKGKNLLTFSSHLLATAHKIFVDLPDYL